MADRSSPFPPEVVERVEDALVHVGGASFMAPVALSVIADYLRSEEAKQTAAVAACNAWADQTGNWPPARTLKKVSDAVISALLGEKEQG